MNKILLFALLIPSIAFAAPQKVCIARNGSISVKPRCASSDSILSLNKLNSLLKSTSSTLKGEKGDPGIPGPKGDKGDQGLPGSSGTSGVRAPSGTFYGMVNTESAGSSPVSYFQIAGANLNATTSLGVNIDALMDAVMPINCVASSLTTKLVYSLGPPSTTGYRKFTLQVNGSDTPLNCTISGSALGCAASASVQISQGDRVRFKMTNSILWPSQIHFMWACS